MGRAKACTIPSKRRRTSPWRSIAGAVREAGIRLNLSITDSATYYGEATFGNSRWLDSTMGITEYGHRGVPNVLLGAPLLSDGTWNSAHFKNKRYDQLVGDYFYYFLSGSKDYVSGVVTNPMGQMDVSRAGFV